MPLFTTGYAGHGETTPENIKAVLDNLLPQNLGLVYIPKLPRRVPADQPAQTGLRETIKWLVSEVGETGTIPVDDVLTAMHERHATVGDDIVLVMLFDPENEDDVELAKLALSQGVRVVDLCQAGDDLLFEEEAPEPPAEEPAAEPVDDSDPPFETAEVAREVDAAHQAAAEQHRARAAAADRMAQELAAGGITVNVSFQITGTDLNAIADAIVAAMGRQAQASLGQAVFDAPPAPAAAHPGEAASSAPPAASPTKAPGSKAFYYNAEQDHYRPARGIATDGETKVYLTPEQVKEMTAGGLIG